jgi:hypothetical protein
MRGASFQLEPASPATRICHINTSVGNSQAEVFSFDRRRPILLEIAFSSADIAHLPSPLKKRKQQVVSPSRFVVLV